MNLMKLNSHKQQNVIQTWLLGYLVFSLSFYFYRYPFSYNDSVASPTYSETPIFLQLAKYIITIFFFFYGLILFLNPKKKLISNNKIGIPILFSLFIFFICLIKAPFATEGRPSEAIKTIFFLPILFLATLTRLRLNTAFLVKLFYFFLLINFFADSIQIINYLISKRLPALATPGSIFIRFGGLWDDPNSLALFLIVPYALLLNDILPFNSHRTFQRILFFAITIITLFLTISVTGFLSFFIVSIIHVYLKRRFALFTLGLSAILLAVIAIYSNPFLIDLLEKFLIAKEGSKEGHLLLSSFDTFSVWHIFLGSPDDLFFHESYYLQFFFNFGIIGLSILLFFLFLTFRKALITVKALETSGRKVEAGVIYSLFLFLIGFCFANLTLPFFSIYPINFLFWLIFLIIWEGAFY